MKAIKSKSGVTLVSQKSKVTRLKIQAEMEAGREAAGACAVQMCFYHGSMEQPLE